VQQSNRHTRVAGLDPRDQLEVLIAHLRRLRAERNALDAERCEGRLRSPAWHERMAIEHARITAEIRAIQDGRRS